MIKNLFQITLISFVWKRYNVIIISTLTLFAYFWLVGKLHQDFLSYGRLNEDQQYIGVSFLLKWFAFLTGFIIYFVFNTRYFKSSKRVDSKKYSGLGNLSRDKSGDKAINHGFSEDNSQRTESDESDPFEAIRKKERLRSVADFIIEEKDKK